MGLILQLPDDYDVQGSDELSKVVSDLSNEFKVFKTQCLRNSSSILELTAANNALSEEIKKMSTKPINSTNEELKMLD